MVVHFWPNNQPYWLGIQQWGDENILSICAKFEAIVVIDISFSGPEYDIEGCGGWDLEGSLARLYSPSKPSKMLTGGFTCRCLG